MTDASPDPAPTPDMKPRFVRAGTLSFSAWEAGTGPLVLCVHGFPDCARSFRHQLPALAGAGYHGVAPTLRGYEPRPAVSRSSFQLCDLAADVLGWMDDLGAEQAHLVGHDWGAALAQVTAALAPKRVRSLTLLALPPLSLPLLPGLLHPRQLRKSWYMAFFQLPLLPERALGRGLVDRLWRDWSPGWTPPAEDVEAVRRTLDAPGVQRAALSYYRSLLGPPRPGRAPGRRRTLRLLSRPIAVPTLAMTGARDGCIDTRIFDQLPPRADRQVTRVPDAGHFLHQERPDVVNRTLLAWLAHQDRRGG